MAQTNCRHFNGYKPCALNSVCDASCPVQSAADPRILIVHLEALGAVLRSTALLAPIKRKYPKSHITWVTKKPAHNLLGNLPKIDRILTTAEEDLLQLSALEFDIAFCIDKSLAAAGVLTKTRVRQIFGFVADPRTGAILPATPAAEELWEIGLSNHKKFFENTKPETQLICEALELPYRRDEYVVNLTAAERALAESRRRQWAPNGEMILGVNTGCAGAIPYKKFSVEGHRKIIAELLSRYPKMRIVLLGGPEDTDRNVQIAKDFPVITSPTTNGLRDGLCSVEATDVVLTGDSLGMHMAIGLKKWTVAWFGPTCAHEIDFFDRGVAVLTEAGCSPCWKRSCQKQTMCYDLVKIESILAAIDKGIRWHNSSFKQRSSAISFSEAPF